MYRYHTEFTEHINLIETIPRYIINKETNEILNKKVELQLLFHLKCFVETTSWELNQN